MKTHHFLGIHWKERKPYLRFRENQFELKENSCALKTGNNLTIQITGKKHCTGYHDPEKHSDHLCEGNKIVTGKFSQCFKCSKYETTNIFALSALNNKQLEILRNKEYVNYLNLFGNNIIKVGVSTTGRKWSRVLEQGADSTIFFTNTDGVTAREIENFVSKNLQVRQAVGSLEKLKLVSEFLPQKEAKSRLLQLYFKIKMIIPEEYKNTLVDVPEFSYNEHFYNLKLQEDMTNIHLIEKVKENDILSGEIAGVLGQTLLLSNKGKIFAILVKNLKGFLVDFNNDLYENKLSYTPKFVEIKSQIKNQDLFS